MNQLSDEGFGWGMSIDAQIRVYLVYREN